MSDLEKDTHCSYCGASFAPYQTWPRQCAQCGKITFKNPVPVGIMLLPVAMANGRRGVMTVRRSIDPGRGLLALPGGYLEAAETWQEGTARELKEETGIRIDPDAVSAYEVHSTAGGELLVFGLAPALPERDLPPYISDDETTERVILTGPADLAFSLHTAVVDRYFREVRRVDMEPGGSD